MKIYEINNPEFVGNIPIRSEITILPADSTKLKIGWMVKEKIGVGVFNYKGQFKNDKNIIKCSTCNNYCNQNCFFTASSNPLKQQFNELLQDSDFTYVSSSTPLKQQFNELIDDKDLYTYVITQ